MLLGLTLAIMLRGSGAVRTVIRSLLFLPVVLTPVAVGYLFADVFETTNGLLNTTLRSLGLDALAHEWLADTRTALAVVAAVNVWTWTGFSMAIYHAALAGIPEEVVEASVVDGANSRQTAMHIIAPLLRPAHFALIILGVIGTLKTFDLVYVLTRGGPDHASEVPTTLLLRTLLDGRDGRAAAIGTVVFAVAMIVTLVQLWLYSRRRDA
nr:sugar ABC transporter permease [Phytoactinopolyspora alkaliphila]